MMLLEKPGKQLSDALLRGRNRRRVAAECIVECARRFTSADARCRDERSFQWRRVATPGRLRLVDSALESCVQRERSALKKQKIFFGPS